MKAVTERVHVGVGADSRISEEVPGPADHVAALEDRVALRRAISLKVVAGPDPGETGPNHQHIYMLHSSPGSSASLHA